jgi:hypothetical protein
MVEKNIVWFDITMKDAKRVNELESRGETGDDEGDLTLTEALSSGKVVAEISTKIEIHDEVTVQIIVISKMKIGNVRVPPSSSTPAPLTTSRN